MASSSGSPSGGNNTSIKEEQFCVQQDLFDMNTILNKVDTGSVNEPDIPTKSSTEILSELFGAFSAEAPNISEGVEQIGENGNVAGRKSAEEETQRKKKSKRNKSKYKHKSKKHKKKSKSSKKECNVDDSNDARGGGRKSKHASERKKKKLEDSTMSEVRRMPTVDPVFIKVTSDSSNIVKKTVECPSAEPDSDAAKDSNVPVTSELDMGSVKDTASSQVAEAEAKDGMPPAVAHPKQMTTDTKPRPGPGKIVIKNLKFSSVYEETVRQVEEQAKRKAERYEEGELSEDSSENREALPTEDDALVLSAEHSPSQEKNKHKHSRKHITSDDRHHHHHRHRHRHHHHRHRLQDSSL